MFHFLIIIWKKWICRGDRPTI